MKKLVLILCSLCISCSVFAAKNVNMPKAPSKGMLTKAHPIYTLQLNSNPTAGYSWFVVSYPAHLIKIKGHHYIPPDSKLVGAGGMEEWQFVAKPAAFKAPHIIKISMMYARPWEVNEHHSAQIFYVVTQ